MLGWRDDRAGQAGLTGLVAKLTVRESFLTVGSSITGLCCSAGITMAGWGGDGVWWCGCAGWLVRRGGGLRCQVGYWLAGVAELCGVGSAGEWESLWISRAPLARLVSDDLDEGARER